MSKSGERELRSISECEIRAEAEGVISGYAALFDTPSKPIGGTYTEVIARGAFDRTLQTDGEVKLTFNHSANSILSRIKNGTLELEADEKGLHFRGQLNMAIQSHRDLWQACSSGLYDECSFAFSCPSGGDSWSGNTRTLNDVDLLDVALVADPAYQGTSASARAAAISVDNLPSLAELQIKADQLQRNFDNETCARVLKLGAEIRSGEVDNTDDESPEAFDPETGEPLDEYERALHGITATAFDEDSGKLFTREDGTEQCCYDYSRSEAGAVMIDRSSRRVIG